MNTQNNEFQARQFAYELGCLAKECGFRDSIIWQLQSVTAEQKAFVDRTYYRTISMQVIPALLNDLFTLIARQLDSLQMDIISIPPQAETSVDDLEYIIAFCQEPSG